MKNLTFFGRLCLGIGILNVVIGCFLLLIDKSLLDNNSWPIAFLGLGVSISISSFLYKK